MAWPIDETYILSRPEMEALLQGVCWRVLEDVLAATTLGAVMYPGAIITAAMQEALNGLFLRAGPGPKEVPHG